MMRRRVSMADDVAPTLDALARSTAGGHSLQRALGELPNDDDRPFAQLLHHSATASTGATPLHDTLRDLQTKQPQGRPINNSLVPESALALTTLEMLARYGGAVPAALDRAAATVRERRAAAHERRAYAAQARLSALVLSILPVGFAAWGLQGDRHTANFLLHQRLGTMCLAAGLVLNTAGWFWMRRITEGAQ